MMFTVVAIAIMVLSTALVVFDLRNLTRDARTALRGSVREFCRTERLAPNLAFLCLWLMIFGFAYV
ncbi:hypothetical protein [Roseivivax sp. CAU 1761]